MADMGPPLSPSFSRSPTASRSGSGDNARYSSGKSSSSSSSSSHGFFAATNPNEFLARLPDHTTFEQAVRSTYDADADAWTKEEVLAYVDPKPFSIGGMREAYFMVVYGVEDVLVGKRYRKAGKYDKKGRRQSTMPSSATLDYYEDVTMQSYAQLWAESYNKNEPPPPKRVTFLPTFVLTFEGRRPPEPAPGSDENPQEDDVPWIFACEPYLSGQYRKHNGNNGYVSSFERNTPHAFSHYTYEKSHGELVVVDIQGVDDYYTDPQIHTIHQKRFGMGNFGSEGIQDFLDSHKCNSICAGLRLPRYGTRRRDDGTQFFGTGEDPQQAAAAVAAAVAAASADRAAAGGANVELGVYQAGSEPGKVGGAGDLNAVVYVKDLKGKGRYHSKRGHFGAYTEITRGEVADSARIECSVCKRPPE